MRRAVVASRVLAGLTVPPPAAADPSEPRIATASCEGPTRVTNGEAVFAGAAAVTGNPLYMQLTCTYMTDLWWYEISGGGVPVATATGVTTAPVGGAWEVCTQVELMYTDTAYHVSTSCQFWAESGLTVITCDYTREAPAQSWVVEATAVASLAPGVPLSTDVACTLVDENAVPMSVAASHVGGVATASGAFPTDIARIATECLSATVRYLATTLTYDAGCEPAPAA